jgi:hypothetical protein
LKYSTLSTTYTILEMVAMLEERESSMLCSLIYLKRGNVYSSRYLQ